MDIHPGLKVRIQPYPPGGVGKKSLVKLSIVNLDGIFDGNLKKVIDEHNIYSAPAR
jgi:hypothetical protein